MTNRFKLYFAQSPVFAVSLTTDPIAANLGVRTSFCAGAFRRPLRK